MTTKPVKMILGTRQVPQTAPLPSRASQTRPQDHSAKMAHSSPSDTLIGEVENSLAASMEKLTAKERSRALCLAEKTSTLLHINDGLLPHHEACRSRSLEAFGLIQYGPLLHVGISRIRGMTVEDRIKLIKDCTLPSAKGKPTSLKLTKACWLDWQRLWIQVREELWLLNDSRSFGMPELIPMVDRITSQMSFAEMRQELVRITTRRA